MDFLLGFFSFPVAVAAVPFMFLFLLMLVSVFTGFLDDFSLFNADVEGDLDLDTDVNTSATWLPVGITQVPLTVSLTTATFITTVLVYYVDYFLLGLFEGWLFSVVSIAALVLCFLLSLYISAFLLKPLSPLFDKENSFAKIDYVGMSAIIRSNSVSQTLGEAIVTKGSLENQLDVYSEDDASISYGDEVVIVSLNPANNRYLVIKK